MISWKKINSPFLPKKKKNNNQIFCQAILSSLSPSLSLCSCIYIFMSVCVCLISRAALGCEVGCDEKWNLSKIGGMVDVEPYLGWATRRACLIWEWERDSHTQLEVAAMADLSPLAPIYYRSEPLFSPFYIFITSFVRNGVFNDIRTIGVQQCIYFVQGPLVHLTLSLRLIVSAKDYHLINQLLLLLLLLLLLDFPLCLWNCLYEAVMIILYFIQVRFGLVLAWQLRWSLGNCCFAAMAGFIFCLIKGESEPLSLTHKQFFSLKLFAFPICIQSIFASCN